MRKKKRSLAWLWKEELSNQWASEEAASFRVPAVSGLVVVITIHFEVVKIHTSTDLFHLTAAHYRVFKPIGNCHRRLVIVTTNLGWSGPAVLSHPAKVANVAYSGYGYS